MMADTMLGADEPVESLIACSDAIIPADDNWPSGSVGDPSAHLQAVALREPGLIAAVSEALQDIGERAESRYGKSPGSLSIVELTVCLRDVERASPGTFKALVTAVYEAYYSCQPVRAVIERRTGYRPRVAVDGATWPALSEVFHLLSDVGERPPAYREVGE